MCENQCPGMRHPEIKVFYAAKATKSIQREEECQQIDLESLHRVTLQQSHYVTELIVSSL